MLDRDLIRLVAEHVIAEHGAQTIEKSCERFACEDAPGSGAPRAAVALVHGVPFCRQHVPRESDHWLATTLIELLDTETHLLRRMSTPGTS